jgi:rod shape-determining protein MreC
LFKLQKLSFLLANLVCDMQKSSKLNLKNVLIVIAVLALLIFFHKIGTINPIENVVYNFLNPLFSSAHNLSSLVRIKYNEQTSKVNLLGKVKELESQVNQLIVENADLKVLESENKTLREHLDFLSQNKYKYVMSNVISRGDMSEISERTETITIDKGAKNGIYAGLAVLSSQGILVGKIVEADNNISKVALTNNSQCKLAATVLNEHKTSGITEGDLGLTVKMNFIPQSEIIKLGDIIVTSGLENFIHRGLVIGKVIGVDKENNQLWQSATIEPMINPDQLVIVSVALP